MLDVAYSIQLQNVSPGMLARIACVQAFLAVGCVQSHYPVLFRGANGTCAHEFIIDLRAFKVSHHLRRGPADEVSKLMSAS